MKSRMQDDAQSGPVVDGFNFITYQNKAEIIVICLRSGQKAPNMAQKCGQ